MPIKNCFSQLMIYIMLCGCVMSFIPNKADTEETVCSERDSPGLCHCTNDRGNLIVDCARKFMFSPNVWTSILIDLPRNTYSLHFSNFDIGIIDRIQFQLLPPSLRNLFLAENEIKRIEKNSFHHLSNLIKLDLSFNEIDTITSGMFANMTSLESLDLSHNRITNINWSSFLEITNMRRLNINLMGNFIVCDCNILEIREYRKKHNVHIYGDCYNTSRTIAGLLRDQRFVSSCKKTVPKLPKTPATQKPIIAHSYQKRQLIIRYSVTLRTQTKHGQKYMNSTFHSLLDNLNKKRDLRYFSSIDVEGHVNLFTDSLIKGQLTVVAYIKTEDRRARIYLWEKLFQLIVHMKDTNGRQIHANLDDSNLCEKDVTHLGRYQYTWPTSKYYTKAKIRCHSSTRFASRTCLYIYGKAVWSRVDNSLCNVNTLPPMTTGRVTEPSAATEGGLSNRDTTTMGVRYSTAKVTYLMQRPISATEGLKKIKDVIDRKNLSSTVVDEVVKSVLSTSKESKNFTKTDIELSVKIIDVLVDKTADHMSADQVNQSMATLNNLIEAPQESFLKAERENKSVSTLLNAIDKFTLKVPLNGGELVISQPFISLAISDVNSSNFGGLSLVERPSDNTYHLNAGQSHSFTKDGAFLPFDITEHVNSTSSRARFVIYKDDKLFKVLNNDSQDQVISKVMSVSVGNNKIWNLTHSILLTFSHRNLTKEQTRDCVYWDDERHHWSDVGCSKHTSLDDITVCTCDHLTSFSMLLRVEKGVHRNPFLSYLSLIGSIMSLGGVFLTLVIYTIFPKVRKSKHAKILMQLCFAMLILNLFFIISTLSVVLDNNDTCKFVAVMLHYALLSTWMWMAVAAFDMYMALVRVFDAHFDRFMFKASFIAWGLPIIIIVITLSVNHTENYGKKELVHMCWLNYDASMGAILAPFLLIILFNLIAFFFIVKKISGLSHVKVTRQVTGQDRNTLKSQFRGIIGVSLILGLTWIFALFAIGDAREVFEYLFCIFNSLQGTFIFVFYCLMKREVQLHFINMFCPEYSSKELSSSSKGSISTSSKHSVSQRDNTDKSTLDSYSLNNHKRLSQPSAGFNLVNSNDFYNHRDVERRKTSTDLLN